MKGNLKITMREYDQLVKEGYRIIDSDENGSSKHIVFGGAWTFDEAKKFVIGLKENVESVLTDEFGIGYDLFVREVRL